MKQTVVIELTQSEIEKILREYIFEEIGRTVSDDKAFFAFEGHGVESGRGRVTALDCKITFTPAEPKNAKPAKRAAKK